MTDGELFDELDYDGDGFLSRDELRQVASLFGWHWHQAPIYAVLDYLTIRAPLDRDSFVSRMAEMSCDPDGAYGKVLRHGPIMAELSGFEHRRASRLPARGAENHATPRPDNANVQYGATDGIFPNRLEDILDNETALEFASALDQFSVTGFTVSPDTAALLIIDPQRSFTSGEWMLSLGTNGKSEILPIRRAFDNCAGLLRDVYRRAEVMFTRCPFPPDSYAWDDRLEDVIDPGQLYFIKPSNNVFMPTSNGCREWVETLVGCGIKTVVIGGCTLNSCVRISALETLRLFRKDDLSVVVDLSLCGARASNYRRSSFFGGRSSVESAIRDMATAGITVAQRAFWL